MSIYDIPTLHKDDVIKAIKGIASNCHQEAWGPAVLLAVHDTDNDIPQVADGYARFFLSFNEAGMTAITDRHLGYLIEVGKMLLQVAKDGRFLELPKAHNHGWINSYQRLTSDFFPEPTQI